MANAVWIFWRISEGGWAEGGFEKAVEMLELWGDDEEDALSEEEDEESLEPPPPKKPPNAIAKGRVGESDEAVDRGLRVVEVWMARRKIGVVYECLLID